jgi:hypothetical protein
VEQQVGLVEEEDQLGPGHVADLRQVVEQVGEQPHEERREDRRPVLQVRQLDQVDQAPAVGPGLEQVGRLELRFSEERIGPLVLEPDQLAEDHPRGGRREPAQLFQVGLALVTGQEAHHRAQVGEVQQREPGPVGVVEDQAEAGLLGVVEAEHLAQQGGPEGRHRDPQRDAGAFAAQRVVLDGEARRLPLLADRGGPRRDLLVRRAGGADAGEVTLDVGREHGYAGGAELLGQQLQRLGLPGARRAGHQAVPVEHPERDPDGDLRERGRVEHEPAQLQGRPLEGIAGGHRLGNRVVLGTRGSGRLRHARQPSHAALLAIVAA